MFNPQTSNQISGYQNEYSGNTQNCQDSTCILKLLNNLIVYRSAEIQSSLVRGGLNARRNDKKNYQLQFNRGMARLKKDPTIKLFWAMSV